MSFGAFPDKSSGCVEDVGNGRKIGVECGGFIEYTEDDFEGSEFGRPSPNSPYDLGA